MTIGEWMANLFLLASGFFFLAGTIGLLRFPDVYTRLHVLAKVDNLGLGFLVLGLLLRADNPAQGLKLVLIWLLVLVSSALVSFLIARRAHRRAIVPWRAGQ